MYVYPCLSTPVFYENDASEGRTYMDIFDKLIDFCGIITDIIII